MRRAPFCLSVALLTIAAAQVHAQIDRREFEVVLHGGNPRVASVYVNVRADDPELPTRFKVWDGLYLTVYPQCHMQVGIGVFAYYFGFSRDPDAKLFYRPTNQPGHGITADEVAAFHFRNIDNSGPNDLGPKNLNAPGKLRFLTYDGFEAEIRVLEMEILNATPGVIPSFASMSCIVCVRETAIPKAKHGA